MTNLFLTIVTLLLFCFPGEGKKAAALKLYERPEQWTSDQGDKVSLNRWKGKYVLATLAFTACRGICPMGLETLKEVDAELKNKKINDVDVLIFSIDPQIDTPEAMAAYRKKHEYTQTHWHFLVSTTEVAYKVAGALNMGFGHKNMSTKQIMHSSKIALIDPSGNVVVSIDSLNGNADPILDYLKKR